MKRGAGHFASRFGLLWLGFGPLSASPASAAPGDATRLEYARSDGAGGCPDQASLQRAVVQRLGYDPFFHAAHQTVAVDITDVGSKLLARMRLVDEQGIIRGSRELNEQLGNCDELVASLALAISIALDPSAALGEPLVGDPDSDAAPIPKKEAAQSRAESPAALAPTAPSAVSTPVGPSHRERPEKSRASNDHRGPSPFAARAAWFGALGAAPSMAVGGRLGGSLRSDWFYFVAELADQLPASRPAFGNAQVETRCCTLPYFLAWPGIRSPDAACFRLAHCEPEAPASTTPSPCTRYIWPRACGWRSCPNSLGTCACS
ncbi:MAG: hypothetical protein ABW061_02900 [Polyangiaceae bacterium]